MADAGMLAKRRFLAKRRLRAARRNPVRGSVPLPTGASRRRVAVAALVVLGALAGAALIVPAVARVDERLVDLGAVEQPPSLAHPLGTDGLGRDVLVRSIYGMRISLGVGVAAAVLATLLGGAVGLVAGTFGGWVDRLMMRFLDTASSLPHLLLGIFLVALFPRRAITVVVVVAVTHWLSTARIVRSEVLSLRSRPFVDAAISGGASRRRVLARHLLPNVVPHIALATVLMVPHAIWHESALSFLGLGLPPHLASLGNMIADGRSSLTSGAWWPSLVPGLFILAPTLAISALSGYLRDRIHPRWRSELQL